VLPVVAALKLQPGWRRVVPRELWSYFDEPLLLSAWYPERDYWVLIAALARTIEAAAVGGDVWRYFAKFSAQRDIGGQGVDTLAELDSGKAGVYRNYAAVNASDPERFFRRATQLWGQYHDTGRMEIAGAHPHENAVVMRLIDFVIPIEGFVLLQGYYLEEYGRMIGIEISSLVTRSTASNHPFCEWEHRLRRTPATEAYVASLPIL
jgi:hypothetical protein